MHWRRILNRFRPRQTSEESGANNRRIDNAVESSVRQLRAVDPLTDEQWQRVRSTLASDGAPVAVPKKAFGMANFRPALASGVALAVLIVVGIVWLLRPSLKIYETGRGQQATIVLPDSTEVMLNHTSKLSVSHILFDRERHVALKGEAYFNVRRNGTPFIVSTDIGTVRVLGTEFNVQGRDGQMEVGVVRGRVRVTCESNGTDSSVVLSEDQIVACTVKGFAEKPSKLPFSDYPGWIHGKIMLFQTDLLSACKELESQFGVTIDIQNPRLLNVTITGTIDGQNVEAALATLANLTGSTVRHEDSGYILY